jgi:CHAT domain-containing protein
MPFAALPGRDEGRYLLEEVALAVVPVPQLLPQLLGRRDRIRPETPPSLLIVGDVDFDAASAGLRSPKPAPATAWQRRRAERAGEAQKWDSLEGARHEVDSIESKFRRAEPQGKLMVLRREEATEEAVRREAPQYEYFHVATHGFFAPGELKSALSGPVASPLGKGEAVNRVVGFPPGLLSGLVLAGANRPPTEGDDGVLTALEVADLDLLGVELAVLSACDTGTGEVAGGEGVLGLQRAFQVAGARGTVTSLWKVDDKNTRSLMERLYENYWIEKSSSALEALRRAQLALLREGDKERAKRVPVEEGPVRTPPYYWAAFVLSGDWR